MMKQLFSLSIVVVFSTLGCNAVTTPMGDMTDDMMDDTSSATATMREACPLLMDDIIEGWVQVFESFRDNGTSEADATNLWVESCDDIPTDGNFLGDVEACKVCLPVIITEVYAAGG